MIICQGVPIMHHFEHFTVDLDEKLGDSLLGYPQLYHNMGFPGDPKNGFTNQLCQLYPDNQKEVPKAPPSNKFSINLVSTKIKTPLEAFLKGFSEVPSGIEPL